MTTSSVELSVARDSLKGDILVLGAVSGTKGARLITDAGDPEVAAQLALFDFAAKQDEILRLPSQNPAFGSVAVIGLGAVASTDAVRAAAASAVRQLVGKKSVVIDLGLTDEVGTAAALLGATLGERSRPSSAPSRRMPSPRPRTSQLSAL
jgi:leucyl aminopeptidase